MIIPISVARLIVVSSSLQAVEEREKRFGFNLACKEEKIGVERAGEDVQATLQLPESWKYVLSLQKCLPPTIVLSTCLDFMFHWIVSETETSKSRNIER